VFICFRCRGGKFYGWGNITRLSILANKLYKKGHKINFIYEGDKFIDKFLKKFSFKKIKLKEDITLKDEKKIFLKIKKIDYFFVEMLDIGIQLQKFYKTKTKNLIIFDDLLDKCYFSNYVIACQDHSKTTQKNIIKSNNTKLICNKKYFMLPESFQKKECQIKKINMNINSILIFLGGGDYAGAYIKIAKSLIKTKIKKIIFILTKSNYNSLYPILKSINKKFKILNGTSNSFKDFSKSDLAIVSGGYTKFESAASLTPCIIILTQWHQGIIANNFCKANKVKNLGHYSVLAEKNLINEISRLKKKSLREKIILNFKKNISYDGTENLLKLFKL